MSKTRSKKLTSSGTAKASAEESISVSQAARLKDVTPAAVYKAVHSKRLSHHILLGHIGLNKAEVLAWNPIGHRAGRPKGTPVSDEAKKRMSASQKQRWARDKAARSSIERS